MHCPQSDARQFSHSLQRYFFWLLTREDPFFFFFLLLVKDFSSFDSLEACLLLTFLSRLRVLLSFLPTTFLLGNLTIATSFSTVSSFTRSPVESFVFSSEGYS